jgi:hypothetical protein
MLHHILPPNWIDIIFMSKRLMIRFYFLFYFYQKKIPSLSTLNVSFVRELSECLIKQAINFFASARLFQSSESREKHHWWTPKKNASEQKSPIKSVCVWWSLDFAWLWSLADNVNNKGNLCQGWDLNETKKENREMLVDSVRAILHVAFACRISISTTYRAAAKQLTKSEQEKLSFSSYGTTYYFTLFSSSISLQHFDEYVHYFIDSFMLLAAVFLPCNVSRLGMFFTLKRAVSISQCCVHM